MLIPLILLQYDYSEDYYDYGDEDIYYEEMSRRGSYVVFGAGYEYFITGKNPNAPVGFVGIRIIRTDDPRAYFTILGGGAYSFTSDFWHASGGILYERRTTRFGGRFAFHLGIGLLGGYYSWGDDGLPFPGEEKKQSPVLEFPVRAAFSVRFGSFEIMPEISGVPAITLNLNSGVMIRGMLYLFYGPESEQEFFEAHRKKEEREKIRQKPK